MTAETRDNPRSVAIEGISSQEPRGTVGRGLAAGFGASVWTALLGLAVIPFYVRFLGLEGYGLIGFLATAQAVLSLLDLGLAATVNREVARSTATGEPGPARSLLRSAGRVYWAIALAIGAVLVLAAPAIAARWLQADTLSAGRLAGVVALMGLVIACRWPATLYHGALMGAQRVATSSAISAAAATLGALGALLVLAFVSPSVQAFLLWQAAVGLTAALVARNAAWRALGAALPSDPPMELGRILRFAAGVSGVAIAGVVLTQVDKVTLSKVLPLAEYGAYMLAVAIAGTLYLFSQPFFNVLYPRFSLLAHAGDAVGLGETYRVATRLLGALAFPAAMVFCVFPRELVQVWTRDAALAAAVAPVLPLLAAGVALHCVMHVPYALQLAHGRTRLPLAIGLVMLVGAVPLTVSLASAYGAVGGAAAWLTLHALAMLLGSAMTHRVLHPGPWAPWVAFEVGVPATVAAAAGGLAWSSAPADAAPTWRLAAGLAWGLVAFAVTVAVSPALRASLLQYARAFAARVRAA